MTGNASSCPLDGNFFFRNFVDGRIDDGDWLPHHLNQYYGSLLLVLRHVRAMEQNGLLGNWIFWGVRRVTPSIKKNF